MLHHTRQGAGPALVLQHGFLGGGGYWAPQLPTLCRHFEVLTTDMPGFAGSAAEPVPQTMAGFAAALAGLLDALDLARVSLVGHSMGGMLALQFALDHPERLDRLVLYGTACSGRLPKRFETMEQTVERLREQGAEACAERIVPTWFVDGERAPHFPMCRAAGRGAATEGAIRAIQAIDAWDVSARLGEVHVPTLVLCGDRDRSTAPDQSMRLYEGIAGAQLAIVPGCAHNVHLERPELFNALLTTFLTALRP